MEDLTRNKVVSFTYNEFEKFIDEATYGTIDITWDNSDGWFWLIRNLNTDEEINEWLEEYGEEARKEVDSVFDNIRNGCDTDCDVDDDEFIYRMIGKKLNAIVKRVVVDVNSDIVVIIFE